MKNKWQKVSKNEFDLTFSYRTIRKNVQINQCFIKEDEKYKYMKNKKITHNAI